MSDTEPARIIDLGKKLKQRQQEADSQMERTQQTMALYETFTRSGKYETAQELAILLGGAKMQLATAPDIGIIGGDTSPSYSIDLTTLPDEVRETMQEAAGNALLAVALRIQQGDPTSLTVHTADHVEGYPDEAIVSVYSRGEKPTIKLDELPKTPTLESLLGLISQPKISPTATRKREIIPEEAAHKPLLTFIVERWHNGDTHLDITNPKVTSIIFSNATNGPRALRPPTPQTPPTGAK